MFTIPHGIRLDPEGNVWTVDAHTSMVYKFAPGGEKLLEINVGGVPDSTQRFCGATDVAFGPQGRVFVSDGYCNARIIEYDSTGAKVREWGRPGTGPGEFKVAHGIAIGPQGWLYVADRENGRVQWFTLEGKFLGQWQFGGQLLSVAFGPAGEVYVATHPKGVSLDDEFYLVQLDATRGTMVGKVPVRAHEVSVGADGTVYPATRNSELLLVRPRK
jgi:DNA-binding beta-propeller fold protein YncE